MKNALPRSSSETPSSPTSCPLCLRPLGTENLDQHHLIPKQKGGKVLVTLHRICHRAIHANIPNNKLEKKFNTVEALLEHPAIADFVKWVAKKDPAFLIGTKQAKGRR